MRLAVLADIHGNLAALDAVIDDLERTKPDVVVNLGDCLSGPLQARETAERLMGRDWLTVRGNHDRYLIETPVEALHPSDRAAAGQLEPRHFEWLRMLPFSARPAADVVLFHATPTDDNIYLTERPTAEGHVVRSMAEVQGALAGVDAGLVLCGHSHIPRLMEFADGMCVFNPGSVGLQAYDDVQPFSHVMQAGSPHARYGIAERCRTGWRFATHALRYDWESAARLALSRGRDDWAYALSTGLALKTN